MFVLCVGMYRSSSTWQYEIAGRIVQRYLSGQPVGVVTPQQFAALDDSSQAWRVLKFHDANQPMAAALGTGRALALYSFRDLRDVVFSLMHKFNASFDEIVIQRQFIELCLGNDAFWRGQPNVLCQRYEDIVRCPAAAVRDIATHLGLRLPGGEDSRLAAEFSLSANRRRTHALARRLVAMGLDLADPAHSLRYDPQSLLHWNHCRQGEIGAWTRQASAHQLRALGPRCGHWLIEQGYERDLGWVLRRDRKGSRRAALAAWIHKHSGVLGRFAGRRAS